jgi:formylglycine-generating enzyme required for sulfatase activity
MHVTGSATTPEVKVVPSLPFKDMTWIAGGTFLMGSDKHYPEESPAHSETVDGFWIDNYEVTNEQFAKFVEATGYVTLAERPPNPEDYPGAKPELLQPASVVFQKPPHRVDLRNHYNWWTYVPGANWRHPEGPGSSIERRSKHPVVHIAYEDAEAYAKWIGKEVPSEAEWEFAARGGLDHTTYAWGEEFTPNGKFMANTWQGEFPWQNLGDDGYESTSPVGKFPPNGFGLFDMIGNVWEWTSDWYSAHHLPAKPCCGNIKPKGVDREQSYDPQMPNIRIPRRVIKGGSYLCAPNYCRRYRPAARMAQPIDTSTCHVGLRLMVKPRSHSHGNLKLVDFNRSATNQE